MGKEISEPFNVVCSAAVSATTTFTSSNSSTKLRDTIVYQVNYTGAPIGILQINGSLDYNPGYPQSAGSANPGSWFSIASLSFVAGMPQPICFNIREYGGAWTQMQFVSSTSSGILGVWTAAKSLG